MTNPRPYTAHVPQRKPPDPERTPDAADRHRRGVAALEHERGLVEAALQGHPEGLPASVVAERVAEAGTRITPARIARHLRDLRALGRVEYLGDPERRWRLPAPAEGGDGASAG